MSRIRYLDSLRALATFAVVVIHVASNNWYGFVGAPDWLAFTVYAGLCKFCVPVFFMISGVLFLNPKRSYCLKRLYLHNIGRLILFLLAWSFVYLVFHVMEAGEGITFSTLLDCAKSILKGDTQTHFWFVYALIGIYMVAPIIKVFTDNAQRRLVEYFLILWLLIQSVFDAVSQVPLIAPVFHNVDKMLIQVTTSYLGFFVLGRYLDEYEMSLRMRRLIYGFGALGVIVSIGLTMCLSIRLGAPDASCFGYFFPGIVLYSAAVFVFLKQWDGRRREDEKRPILQKMVNAASRYSLGVYGIHMLFVFLLWDMGVTTFSFWGCNFGASDFGGGVLGVAIGKLGLIQGSSYQ